MPRTATNPLHPRNRPFAQTACMLMKSNYWYQFPHEELVKFGILPIGFDEDKYKLIVTADTQSLHFFWMLEDGDGSRLVQQETLDWPFEDEYDDFHEWIAFEAFGDALETWENADVDLIYELANDGLGNDPREAIVISLELLSEIFTLKRNKFWREYPDEKPLSE